MQPHQYSISIYNFPRKRLAEALYGSCSAGPLRRIEAYLSGEKKMTVDTLYVLFRCEPMLDLERSLADLYARYEVAKFKKIRKANYGEKPFEVMATESRTDQGQPIEQASDSGGPESTEEELD